VTIALLVVGVLVTLATIVGVVITVVLGEDDPLPVLIGIGAALLTLLAGVGVEAWWRDRRDRR